MRIQFEVQFDVGTECALRTFLGTVLSLYCPRDGTVGFRRSPLIRLTE